MMMLLLMMMVLFCLMRTCFALLSDLITSVNHRFFFDRILSSAITLVLL
jgi:hypothetical protein